MPTPMMEPTISAVAVVSPNPRGAARVAACSSAVTSVIDTPPGSALRNDCCSDAVEVPVLQLSSPSISTSVPGLLESGADLGGAVRRAPTQTSCHPHRARQAANAEPSADWMVYYRCGRCDE